MYILGQITSAAYYEYCLFTGSKMIPVLYVCYVAAADPNVHSHYNLCMCYQSINPIPCRSPPTLYLTLIFTKYTFNAI